MELLFLLVIAVAIWIAASQSLPTANLVLIIALVFRLQPYILWLQADIARLFRLEHSLVSVSEALNAGRTTRDGGTEPFRMGELRFDGVTLNHVGAPMPALRDVSFVAQQGEFVALVGASAAGKSTVANILLRLFEPSGGTVLLDQMPINEVKRASWLSHVTLTGQDSELLTGTLADNLLMSCPKASRSDMEMLLKQQERLISSTNYPKGSKHRLVIAAQDFPAGNDSGCAWREHLWEGLTSWFSMKQPTRLMNRPNDQYFRLSDDFCRVRLSSLSHIAAKQSRSRIML